MSRRGNDLVRRYLWMAALVGVRYNPAVRALYARVVAKHPDRKAIAIGHAMRKLLHLVFAIWKTGRPFDANHYPWQAPAQREGGQRQQLNPRTPQGAVASTRAADSSASKDDVVAPQATQAAGLSNPDTPARPEVTAVWESAQGPEDELSCASPFVDFAYLKRQLPLARVLDQLGLSLRLRGQGSQRRCACPIHRGDNRGRSFSVNLAENVFCCHDTNCGKQGDVIDLWAAVRQMSLRQAALDLVRTFALEPAPAKATEKRHG
jgi:hypothetical protein